MLRHPFLKSVYIQMELVCPEDSLTFYNVRRPNRCDTLSYFSSHWNYRRFYRQSPILSDSKVTFWKLHNFNIFHEISKSWEKGWYRVLTPCKAPCKCRQMQQWKGSIRFEKNLFWEATSRRPTEIYQSFGKCTASMFTVDDGESTSLQNVNLFVPFWKASHERRISNNDYSENLISPKTIYLYKILREKFCNTCLICITI